MSPRRRSARQSPCSAHTPEQYTPRVTDFLVQRGDLRIFRTADGEHVAEGAEEGAVQFKVERFGLTANNLTYGVFGEAMGYWNFFSAPEGWGRLPAWGFGEAVASGVDGVVPGDRFYGYWPMSSYVTLQGRTNSTGFVETSPARAALHPFYNGYLRAIPEAGFEPDHDDIAAIMRPFVLTGWLIADQLAAKGWHGAEAVVLTSASSKTSYATAWAMGERGDAPPLIGLTSSRNVEFAEGLGVYDEVLTYKSIGELSGSRRLVLIDVAGSPDLRRQVHEAAGKGLQASIMVGATHWENATLAGGDLPGPEPELFFAPAVAEERAAALGPSIFAERIGAAWAVFAARGPDLIEIKRASGPDALAAAYVSFIEGRADPRQGLVFSL